MQLTVNRSSRVWGASPQSTCLKCSRKYCSLHGHKSDWIGSKVCSGILNAKALGSPGGLLHGGEGCHCRRAPAEASLLASSVPTALLFLQMGRKHWAGWNFGLYALLTKPCIRLWGIWARFCFGGEEAAEANAFCGQSLSCYLLRDLFFILFIFFSDLIALCSPFSFI